MVSDLAATPFWRQWQERYGKRFARWQSWRHFLHRHPELAFAEEQTAQFIAERLSAMGLSPEGGWAKTGVVARCQGARGPGPTILLRADMDALPIDEANTFAHRSNHPGRMHACGHDGHIAMLLAAAEVLAEHREFAGTVLFVFQPAEEEGGGARVMVEAGLLEQFDVAECYALHNWPGLPVGTFAVHAAAVMAGTKSFDLIWRAAGTHAAMPHLGSDLIVAASQFVTTVQSVVSRHLSPTEAAVLSVTQFHAGSAYNVLPSQVVLSGTVRALRSEVLDEVADRAAAYAQALAKAIGAEVEWRWYDGYPPTCNDPAAADRVALIAQQVVGAEQVLRHLPPSMGAEDFAYFLEKRPGAYLWIGNGPGTGGCVLHNSHYDFNDAILPIGAAFWNALVLERLGK